MAMSVRLSDEIIIVAKKFASVMDRSCAGQIEYWTKIGKMAEENPDLSYSFIKDHDLVINVVRTRRPTISSPLF